LTSGGLNLTAFVITDLLYSTLKQNITVADEIITNLIKGYSINYPEFIDILV